MSEDRLRALYDGQGFGGENTMRARVIRELIDEIRSLRAECSALRCAGSPTQEPSGGEPG